MFSAITNLPSRTIAKAFSVLRRFRLDRETRRLDRLYGALPAQIIAESLDDSAQANRLRDVISAQCEAGAAVIAAHDRASITLDSAEYAFSSLLDELRGVMTKLPTNWTPDYAGMSSAADALLRQEAHAA